MTQRRDKNSKNKQQKGYFYEEEEQAVIDYKLATNKIEKEQIFATKLYRPFSKMVESIMRRYGLFTPSEEFEDTFFDCLSYLVTKIDKFRPETGHKAYSYFGTICRNHLLYKRKKEQEKQEKQPSYETMFPTADKDKRVDDAFDPASEYFHRDLIEKTILQIENILSNGEQISAETFRLGCAIRSLLINWDKVFKEMGTRKFNKSCAYEYIRGITGLNTKEIREGLKTYKDLYFFTKKRFLDEG